MKTAFEKVQSGLSNAPTWTERVAARELASRLTGNCKMHGVELSPQMQTLLKKDRDLLESK